MAIQLALLSGATPRTCARGPFVRLQRGRWKLECSGLDDSRLNLNIMVNDHLPLNITRDLEFDMQQSGDVQVEFEGRGNEKHISIFVTKVA